MNENLETMYQVQPEQAIEQPIEPVLQPKPNNFLVILLSILLLLAISAAGFFAFQTQKLVAELRIKNEELIVKAPEPIPTYEPGLEPEPIPIEILTADWETYTNQEQGYSMKYPKTGFLQLICPDEELTLTNNGIGNQISPVVMPTCARGGRYTLETKTYSTLQPEPEETKYYSLVKEDVMLGGLNGKLYTHTFTNIEDGPYPEWYAIARVNKDGKTYEVWFDDKQLINMFKQILSTFKFLD